MWCNLNKKVKNMSVAASEHQKEFIQSVLLKAKSSNGSGRDLQIIYSPIPPQFTRQLNRTIIAIVNAHDCPMRSSSSKDIQIDWLEVAERFQEHHTLWVGVESQKIKSAYWNHHKKFSSIAR
jgi:hypothetical protein